MAAPSGGCCRRRRSSWPPHRGTAQAAPALPVSYDFREPSAAHPDPVVLVHGTFANMDDNWQTASPVLVNHGYCVFAFNYGDASASSVIQGAGDIAASAQQLASFVDSVLAATEMTRST